MAIFFPNFEPSSSFDRAVAAFAENPDLQEEFIQSHDEQHLFDNFTFSPFPGRSLFQYTTYDAVIAMGLAACDTPGLFRGKEFYDQLLKVNFEGVSGAVQFDKKTGTRVAEGMLYQIANLVLKDFIDGTDNASQAQTVMFKSDAAAIIDLSAALENPNSTALIEKVNDPFIYNDNTTTPPPLLPPAEVNMNLIPAGVRAFGLSLAVLVMMLSLGCALWTYFYTTEYVVKAAQPIFLGLICLGTFIVAPTIIPLSFQEDMPGLDVACACIPWRLYIGFTVAIAALQAKAHKINKLMQSGTSFRRIRVHPADVIKPFVALLSINVALLTAWTASPW